MVLLSYDMIGPIGLEIGEQLEMIAPFEKGIIILFGDDLGDLFDRLSHDWVL